MKIDPGAPPTFARTATLMKFAGMDGDAATRAAAAYGLEDPRFYDDGVEARVLAGRLGGVELIIPQGTKNPRGWWRNFNLTRRKIHPGTLTSGTFDNTDGRPLGKSHRGIANTWAKVAGFCADRAEGAERVDVYGHSAGGMVGSLVALSLAEQGVDVRRVVSCGKGRWCNRQLGKALRQHERIGEVWRIVHHRDGVPLLPFVGSSLGRWQHETGKDGVEDGAKVLYLDDQDRAIFDASFWTRAKARFRAGGTEPTVDDIGGVPQNVVERLKAAGFDRLDDLIGKGAGAIAALTGVPAPIAGLIARQVRELSVGAWIVGLFGEAVSDHYIAHYEHALHVADV